jgi:hypothetical protein
MRYFVKNVSKEVRSEVSASTVRYITEENDKNNDIRKQL